MPEPQGVAQWQLIPHAHLRVREGGLIAGAPAAAAHVCLPEPWGVLVWQALRHPSTITELTTASGAAPSQVAGLVADLHEVGLITPGQSQPAWSDRLAFHDALLHARSRGITDEGFGKASGGAPPTEPLGGDAIGLPTPKPPWPDPARSRRDVLSERRTTRDWSTHDLALADLSALLWSGAGDIDGSGEHFPYPYAGPAQATGILVAAGRIAGLAPALYAYRAASHDLIALPRVERADRERLPVGDYVSTVASGRRPGERHPQAMIIVTADLVVMSSAYAGIAYANILKTTGAILATFSLAAAALDLGTTILGLASDADTRELWHASGSRAVPVGEMALGLPRTGQ